MKSSRDSHVDIFGEITIKESIADIKLLQVPIVDGRNARTTRMVVILTTEEKISR